MRLRLPPTTPRSPSPCAAWQAQNGVRPQCLSFTRVPHQMADQLDEAGHNPEDQKWKIEPVRAECLVQQIADRIANERGGRQEECQGGVLAYQHAPRFLRHESSVLVSTLDNPRDQLATTAL